MGELRFTVYLDDGYNKLYTLAGGAASSGQDQVVVTNGLR